MRGATSRARTLSNVHSHGARWSRRLPPHGKASRKRTRPRMHAMRPSAKCAIAWKGDRDAQPGDVCTVREGASLYGWREGSPGHLQIVGGKLLCVPDKQQDSAPTSETRLGNSFSVRKPRLGGQPTNPPNRRSPAKRSKLSTIDKSSGGR